MRPAWPDDLLTRLSRRVLRGAAFLVPSWHQHDWLREWEAELWQLRQNRGRVLDLGLFLGGACWHGLWEWKEGWRMESVVQDTKVAARTLARSPGFAGVAVLMLALAIGANTALFSVLEEAVLARPPFAEADRLVVVDQQFSAPGEQMTSSQWSYPRFQALREDVQSVQMLSGYSLRTMTLTELGDPTVVSVESVTPSLFPLLGVSPVQGRAFVSDGRDEGAADMSALVSHSFWQSRMGGAPDAVGTTLTLDRLRFEILGVLPPGFDGITGGADVWIPFSALREVQDPSILEDPWNQHFYVVGRLAADASLASARSEAQAFGATVMERFPPPPAASRVVSGADVLPFTEARMNPVTRTSMVALFGAVILVLLIAVANLAGLLLARGATRQREAAIRASLGAGRGRLMRQLLTESLMLAVVGGALGLGLAWFGVDLLGAWLGEALGTGGARGLQYFDPEALSVNRPVLLFALGLTGVVGVGCGLLPAWQAARSNPIDAFQGAPSAGGIQHSLNGVIGRSGLIVIQVAVAMVLLVGAGGMMRTLVNLQRVDVGYDPQGMLTAMYSLSPADEEAGIDLGVFHMEYLERVRSLPGVLDATLGEVPMGGPTWRTIVMASDGLPELTPQDHWWIRLQPVADNHLSFMGARIIEGRDIQATDDRNSEKVVVLSRTAAEGLFPDGSPIGRRLSLGWAEYRGEGAVVVGVVEGLRLDGPSLPQQPQAYLSLRQAPRLASGVIVRTSGPPEALIPALRSTLTELAPNVALTSVMSIETRALNTTARPRVVTLLLSLFGALSLFLVAAGLYGTVAFAVARRTKELGLRASLGAGRGAILALVLRQGVGVTLVGMVVGLAGARWGGRFLDGLLFGTTSIEPASLAAVCLVLFVVALAAAYLPARRALKIDPMSALRTE